MIGFQKKGADMRAEALEVFGRDPLSSKYGTHKTVTAIFWA